MMTLFKRKPPEPQKIIVSDTSEYDGNDAAYAALAAKARFVGYQKVRESAEMDRQNSQFEGFLAENGICQYDIRTVRKYLNKICPTGYTVIWVGIDGGALFTDFTRYARHYSPYAKPIPDVVLMTIVKIRENYPKSEFFVSDFARIPKGDPFLAVKVNEKFYVIERWDEPGFRM